MGVNALGFGLLTCQRHPADARTWPEIYSHALETATLAERLGFDSVWTSEHHFFDDGYLGSQMTLLAAIAARTSRIALGPCVVLLPLYDPLRLAEDVISVDLLSSGRLIFAAGLGWREEELAAFGVGPRNRVPRFVSAMQILSDAWSRRPVRTGPDRAVFITPSSARHGGPPVWFAAMAEVTARRAGRLADGFVATRVTPIELQRLERAALEERRASGREQDPLTVAIHHPVFAWRGDDAWQRLEPYLHYVDWKYDDMTEAWGRRPGSLLPPPVDRRRREYLSSVSLWGAPERVAEGIARYAESLEGDLHFIARGFLPGLDLGIQRESMHIFAEEVVPLLRSTHSRTEVRSTDAR